jgi:hypothetical protein
MRQEWLSYLDEIGVPQRHIGIVEKKIDEVSKIFGVEILRIFISNKRTEDQQEEFKSLWLFTADKAIECKNFISKDDYDVLYFDHKVTYVNIIKSNYDDRDNPVQESSLSAICFLTTSNLSCTLNAVNINVKFLLNIIKEVYLANLV